MVKEPNEPADKAFRQLKADNPLRKLEPPDKDYLWATLRIYVEARSSPASAKLAVQPFREALELGAVAQNLAGRLESTLAQDPFPAILLTASEDFRDLPARLLRLSARLEEAAATLGTPGHQHKVLTSRYLVAASEFVKQTLGRYYDERLADLLQAVSSAVSPNLDEDMSGDAIRRKRERLSQQNPAVYQQVCLEASQIVNAPVPPT